MKIMSFKHRNWVKPQIKWFPALYCNGELVMFADLIHCRDCKNLVSFDDCCEVMCKPLNRPPQSWCYVEELL